MRRPPTRVVVPVLVGLYLLASIALAGCNKLSFSTTSETPAPGGSDQASAGKKLFDANCMKCHSVSAAPSGGPGPGGPGPGGPRPGGPGGPGGPGPGGPGGGGKGPSLAKVGADPTHTRDWLADHVRDPQKHKPNSRMPKFAEKLKDEDILTLADYLASLK
jgi:mono/diheme cytochrome c family protein